MKLSLSHIIRRSLLFYKSGSVYLFLIIVLLTAVITGSLLTGSSVRRSLKKVSLEKLGKTAILISSSNRYFDPEIDGRMTRKTGLQSAGILEINGYCQSFTTGQSALGIKIFGIGKDFFPFQNNPGIEISKGEAAINQKLADYLGLKKDDELIIHFEPLSYLPLNAPFAPDKKGPESLAFKIARILTPEQSGNFSLGISQITPLNVFVNSADIFDSNSDRTGINRLLIKKSPGLSVPAITADLQEILKPEDIGLSLRYVPSTGQYEIISGRIFIDQVVVDEIKRAIPSSFPVITYLCNSFRSGDRSTPYSFISALPSSLYQDIPSEKGIIINEWMADDLNANEGDTIQLTYYSSDALNRLFEENNKFVVQKVVPLNGIWSDSLLMPEFPGIAGRASCSGWDAGKSINMKLIRKKDEDYWKRYKGTPKAFINYETGKKLWGSNFGPATSVRFPAGLNDKEIRANLDGSIDPSVSGFSVTDLYQESVNAAEEGVDFSTLFLGLGFFIILSALVLLVLVISAFYESKKEQVRIYFSIGFTHVLIEKILFIESILIAFTGTLIGAVTGWLFNSLIIKALNSVWQSAVQTNTLTAEFDTVMILTGFLVSFALILLILWIKSVKFLKNLNQHKQDFLKRPSLKKNILVFIIFLFFAIIGIICSFVFKGHSTLFSFSGGIMMFISLVFLTRHFYLSEPDIKVYGLRKKSQISSLFYNYNSSLAVTPVIFLAAGLFAVIIAGINRMNISESMLKTSGGTGGYLLWGESAIPLTVDLNGKEGRREFGLDDPDLKDLSITQGIKTIGDDASCLNLNHIVSPSLIGLDPSEFVKENAFSFASKINNPQVPNPWSLLNYPPENNVIYGIADQTVLQYGLKISTGDTLILRSESGEKFKMIIAGGLKSSVFQGFVIAGRENLSRYYPSVSGNQIFLAGGDKKSADHYQKELTDRLSEYGVHFEPAGERLASFYVVNNTYLSVFSILGTIGLILGVIGLGFILLGNFNQRKHEFGFMMAAGFSLKSIKQMILNEQMKILFTGVIVGLIPALTATIPSIINNLGVPWLSLFIMISLIIISGLTALIVSLKSVSGGSLVNTLKKE